MEPVSPVRDRSRRAILIALIVAACSTAPPESSSYSTRAYVVGNVRHAGGAPAADLFVRAVGHRGQCTPPPDPSPVATGGGSMTDATGGYRIELIAGHGPFTGCVEVTVFEPVPNGAVLSFVRGPTVPFTYANDAGAYDSVRVDVTLP